MRLPTAEQPEPGARSLQGVTMSSSKAQRVRCSKIAAHRRHVAQAAATRRRATRLTVSDSAAPPPRSGIAHERPDARNPPPWNLDLVLQRKPGDVSQLRRPLDIHLHEIHEIGAAGNEFWARRPSGALRRPHCLHANTKADDGAHRLLNGRDNVGVSAVGDREFAAHQFADLFRRLRLAFGNQSGWPSKWAACK